ncbi:fibronectin type III domain-containing protein [Micromonospora sp. BRA006-A]|nr:fibronectin type III domain-containing protein [Micromonospora sp. BRA006-A]
MLSAAVLGTALIAAPSAGAGTAYPAAAPAPGGAAVPAAEPTGTAPSPTSTPGTPDPPSTTPFPPSAPTNLTATRVRSTSVTLTWTAATARCCPVVGYDITYYQAFDDVVYGLSLGDVTTATITGYIQPGRQYSFRVSARDGDGRRSPSTDALTVVTPVTDTGPDTTPPSARRTSPWAT